MQTYTETVLQFRIVRHTELPESHKAEYRLAGIDPDDNWSLVWSFRTREAAEEKLVDCIAHKGKFDTYKIIDNGEASVIERPVW